MVGKRRSRSRRRTPEAPPLAVALPERPERKQTQYLVLFAGVPLVFTN